MKLSYDLHIHSCLSPCGDNDMLPSNIVGMAALKELDVIALTDHNSCKNCPAFEKIAAEYGIVAISGMELTTSDEVHVVCLFPSLEKALEFDSFVYEKLFPIENNEKIFGEQLLVDENDNIIAKEKLLLSNATQIGFDELYELLIPFGGVMIPAHIDKSTTSLLSNLGFISEDNRFSAAEIKHIGFVDELLSKHKYLENCTLLSSSDAHYLEDINEPVNFLEAKSKSVSDILEAISTSKCSFIRKTI